MTDARMSINLPGHPKMKRVIRSLGDSGAWHVVKLFLWVAGNRPDGDLSGMTADDIELSIDWTGTPSEFVRELLAVRFLDETDAGYCVHDWEEHNPWAAGTEMRAEKAKFNAFCRHYGKNEAAKRMPEYASRIGIACEQHASSMRVANPSSAPSPSPSPSVDQEPLHVSLREPAKKSAKGSRLNSDWIPTESMVAYAAQRCPRVNVLSEAENFRDYWISKPGAGGVKLDWEATWRTWVRRAEQNATTRPHNPGARHATNHLSLADRAAAIHANRPREHDDWIDGTATPVHR